MVVVVILLPLLVSGLPTVDPRLGCGSRPRRGLRLALSEALRAGLVPWQLVVFASGLFLAVAAAARRSGRGRSLAVVAGSGDDLARPSGSSPGVGMLGANAVNNLPAYLAFESVADSPARLAALLVGVNAGSLITPWASLATLLWHQRLHAVGVDVPWRRYVLLGLLAAPLIVALAVIPLAL